MFEHLTPAKPVKMPRKNGIDFRPYVGLVFVCLIALAFLFSSSRGPVVIAESQDYKATVAVDSSGQAVAVANPQIQLFKFVINTDRAGVSLSKLKIYVNGLYDPSIFDNLKLYNGNTQLGFVEKFDQVGNIYFNPKSYKLASGQNEFHFVLTNNTNIKAGDVLRFILQDSSSIFLSYKGHLFTPRADYPLSGSTVSLVHKGYITGYNLLTSTKLLTSAQDEISLANFQLEAKEEMIDLDELTVEYKAGKGYSLSGQEFQFYQDDKLLAISKADDKKIIFSLDRPIVVGSGNKPSFIIKAVKLPVGNYNFSLVNIKGRGFASGLDVSLAKNLFLSELVVKSYYLQFSRGNEDSALSNGWNNIFDMNVKPKGSYELQLNKLSWSVDTKGLIVSDLELWVDGQKFLLNLKSANNRLVLDLRVPIIISQDTNIKLVAKIKDIKTTAGLQVFLLSDKNQVLNKKTDNILWSRGDKFYNSYFLPDLPLSPFILTKAKPQ